jgi:hypothetical protein
MNPDSKINLKSLIALAVIGYVCVLLINYVEGIITSIIKILGLAFNISPNIYFYLEIIPSVLIIIFWIILITRYLKDFNLEVDISIGLPQKFAIRTGLTTLLLFVGLLVIRYFERELWASKASNYFPDQNQLITKSIILQILNIVEVGVIAFGFIKIFAKQEESTL